MIEIKGNMGKSVIFEKLMTSDTLGIIIDNSFRNVCGDHIFIINPENFEIKEFVDFIEAFPFYKYSKIMVYTNFEYDKVKPIINWMNNHEEKTSFTQCIIFYK
jgi:hypothetical protein